MSYRTRLASQERETNMGQPPYHEHLSSCLECLRDPLNHKCAEGEQLFKGAAFEVEPTDAQLFSQRVEGNESDDSQQEFSRSQSA